MSFYKKNKETLNLVLSLFLLFGLVTTAILYSSVRQYETEAKGRPTKTTATLSVTPASSSSEVLISGTGFKAGSTVFIGIIGAFLHPSIIVVADDTGSISENYTMLSPGTYVFEAWQNIRKDWQKTASTTYTY